MAKPATKFKRYTNAAVNHPGTRYRFKKVLRDPAGLEQASLRYWTNVVCYDDVVSVEVCAQNVSLFIHTRTVAELRAGTKTAQARVLEDWWQEIGAKLHEALVQRALNPFVA